MGQQPTVLRGGLDRHDASLAEGEAASDLVGFRSHRGRPCSRVSLIERISFIFWICDDKCDDNVP